MKTTTKAPKTVIRKDLFEEATSKEVVGADYDLFKRLFAEIKRQVGRQLYTSGSAEVEDVAVQCIEKFYATFDFAKLQPLPNDQRRRLVFGFLHRIVGQTIVDHWREGRIVGVNSAPVEITEQQLPLAKQALQTLTAEEQRLLELKYVVGFSYPELRKTFYPESPSDKALTVRVHRLIKKLRVQL